MNLFIAHVKVPYSRTVYGIEISTTKIKTVLPNLEGNPHHLINVEHAECNVVYSQDLREVACK